MAAILYSTEQELGKGKERRKVLSVLLRSMRGMAFGITKVKNRLLLDMILRQIRCLK